MRMLAICMGVVLSLFYIEPSLSMNMKFQSKNTLVLSGRVVSGDCYAVEMKINKKIRKIILANSGGGRASEGYCIGELIREKKLNTEIRGRCASSCSRMWLGGVQRRLYDSNSRVGLHGNYRNGFVYDDGIYRLRDWIPRYAPNVDKKLLEKWTELIYSSQMMYFYNNRAGLCHRSRERDCEDITGRMVCNVGLSDLKSK